MSGKHITHTVQFARVVSDKKLKDAELKRGDLVMVMGFVTVPISKSDPYIFRKYVVVAVHKDGVLQIPDDDNDYRSRVVDPRSLEPVSDEEQKTYEAELESQYGEPKEH